MTFPLDSLINVNINPIFIGLQKARGYDGETLWQ